MKELKYNEDSCNFIELLEKKDEFSCLFNHCYSYDGGCKLDVCSQVSCIIDFHSLK